MPNAARLREADLRPHGALPPADAAISRIETLLYALLPPTVAASALAELLEAVTEAAAEKAVAKLGPAVREYLSTDEAADYTGYSPEWFEQRRVKGDGPPFLRAPGGRLVKYSRRQLDEWMLSQQCRHTAENRGTSR